MQHIRDRWADTEMTPGKNYSLGALQDLQLLDDQPEAAHAASEYPDSISPSAAVAWWLPIVVPAVGIIGAALVAIYWNDFLRWWLA